MQSSDGSTLTGRKVWKRYLELVASYDGEEVLIRVEPENAEKLRDWLLKTYPIGDSNAKIKSIGIISVRTVEEDTD